MPGVRTNDGIDFITATEDKKKERNRYGVTTTQFLIDQMLGFLCRWHSYMQHKLFRNFV